MTPPPGPTPSPAPASGAGRARPRWTLDELARAGEAGLHAHLLERATAAHLKYGRLSAATVPRFLQDPDCVRYPTRLVYGFGGMAMHQFAQPAPDPDDPAGTGVVLHLRPTLEHRPELMPLAVAYTVPIINYGESVVTDAHCLLYGATLLGELEEDFYARICAMADQAGATAQFP